MENNKNTFSMSRNHIERTLGKSAADFTRADIIDYIRQEGIEMVNFMYAAADGRLKTLNFVINSLDYLETILPRLASAFRDPFAEIPTLTLLCSYFDKDGNPLDSDPRRVLERACKEFTEVSGLEFECMGELEFYVIGSDPGTFPATDQKGYHESAPFAKFNDFRTKAMSLIASTGGQIKYGHSEVGNFKHNSLIYEQNEIEFLPNPALKAADQLLLAKWIIRTLAAKEGLDVTFAPKIRK